MLEIVDVPLTHAEAGLFKESAGDVRSALEALHAESA
jgi:hypothetical protein